MAFSWRLTGIVLVFALLAFGTWTGWAQNGIDPRVSRDIRDLGNSDPEVRRDAAMDLGNFADNSKSRQQAEKAVPALLHALKDAYTDVRQMAAFALGNIDGNAQAAVPGLVEALKDNDANVRQRSADALGSIGAQPQLAVPALAAALRDEDSQVVSSARDALREFGAEAKIALPAFIDLLQDKDDYRRWCAARALAGIGPDAQPAAASLTAVLKDDAADVRLEAAAALAGIGRNLSQALPVASRLLYHKSSDIRARAAGVVGLFGAVAEPTLGALTKTLSDEDPDVRRIAGVSLKKIARALQEAHRTEAIEALKGAEAAVEQSTDRSVKAQAPAISDAVQSLERLRQSSLGWWLLWPIRTQPWVTSVVALYAVIALVWVGLHHLRPFAILQVNEALKAFPKVRLPGWLGGIEVSLPNLILVGFFQYRDRELDAWVARNIDKARDDFEASMVVRMCVAQSDVPVVLDNKTLPSLGVEDLRPLFARAKICVLIWGDAEQAKMNLVWRIARWGMESDKATRLRGNLMLPVLLDGDFVYAAAKDADPFTKAVRERLLSGEATASEEQVLQLLRRQRILAIVVGLSELTQETKSSIRPSSPDFPANALVITSRTQEALGGARKSIIRPAI